MDTHDLARTPPALPPVVNGPTSDLFLRQLLGAMAAFRDGNFEARMPNDLVGVEGKVADAFN